MTRHLFSFKEWLPGQVQLAVEFFERELGMPDYNTRLKAKR